MRPTQMMNFVRQVVKTDQKTRLPGIRAIMLGWLSRDE